MNYIATCFYIRHDKLAVNMATSTLMQETLSLRVYMQQNCKCSTDRTNKAKKSTKLNAELVTFTHTE